MNEHLKVGAKAHVLVDELVDGSDVVLAAPVVHHLMRVLRLRAGDVVTITNGRGAWLPAQVPSSDTDLFPISAAAVSAPKLGPELCVAFALTKGEKPDFTVQKLTECGIDHIVLLDAQRSVARWDADRAVKHLAKLKLVAAEALMQSRGLWLPKIEGPLSVASFDATSRAKGLAIHRADLDAPPFHADVACLAIGPEGGWDPSERSLMPDAVSFSSTVLRAETAAIVAGGLMMTTRMSKSTHSAWL
jgi:16S rRNA (uracil1498-N3)-methyltransferase